VSRWRFLVGLVVVANVAAVGCGSSSKSANGPSASSSANDVCNASRVGGELTYAPTGLANTLDPYSQAAGTAQTGPEMLALFGSLLRFDAKNNTFVGEQAESITPNADASEWTLKMRPDVKFGNGDPMDAAAVMASIQRNIDPAGTSVTKGQGQFIKSMAVVDPLTLKFTLTQPWGFFPLELTAGGGTVGNLGMIQNVKVVNAIGAKAFGQNPSDGAAGAYVVDSWNPPNQVVLKPKPNWWGGTVCIQKLTFVGLNSIQARLDGMASGSVNMATLSRDPVATADAVAKYPNVFTIDQGNSDISINQKVAELSDVRVRQAIAMAIDPKVINDRAFGGKGLAGNGLVYPDPANGIAKGTSGVAYDPNKAKALVTQLKGEGMKLSFELILANSPSTNVQAGIAVQSLLNAVGFNITATPLPYSDFLTRVYVNRNFQLTLAGQVGPLPTEYSSLYRFYSSNKANAFGTNDPELDAALDKLRLAQNTKDLLAAMDAYQAVFNKVIPAVTYASDQPTLVWTPNVHGLRFTYITPYFDKAYVTK